MHAPVEVRTSRGYWKRIIGIGIGCGLFAVLGVAQAIHDLRRPVQHDVAYAMFGIAAFLLSIPGIMLFARRWWVRRFDEQGVMLRNGRRFAWSRFQRIEPRKNRRLRMINNYDLVFEDGTAGIYHLMAENDGEVMEIVRSLEAGANPFTS